MMKVLITGGTGFIGSHLVTVLVQRGIRCRLLVRDRKRAGQQVSDEIELFQGDITNPTSLSGLVKGITHVVHLAAMGHVSALSEKAYQDFFQVNVQGTINLIEACRGEKIRRFVHISSTAAMGLIQKESLVNEIDKPVPVTPYQRSTLESERAALKKGNELKIPVVILRPCMVYGKGNDNGEFFKIAELMRKGFFPKVGRGSNLTPLVHVQDVVQAAIAALEQGKDREIYIIASKVSLPMDELRDLIMKAWGKNAFYPYIPARLMFAISAMIELYARMRGNVPIVTRYNIANTVWDREFSIEKAYRELGYEPSVDFASGIDETVSWYREQQKQP
jgi:nucleoside-diphosphate-sugar epimerase